MRIAISVGHGRKNTDGGTVYDSGAVNKRVGISEFDTSMSVFNLLIRLLEVDGELQYINIQHGIPLKHRINVINEMNAHSPFDLAIELHLNANENPKPNYTEIYYWANREGGYSKRSKKYGNIMLPVMIKELGISDGKRDGIAEAFGDEEWEEHRNAFVKKTDCPALIIEPWFISNDAAASEAKDAGLITKTAIAIYKALRTLNDKEFK